MYGYGGRILTLDLTSGQARVEGLGEPFARAFLGGNGFAVRLLYDRVGPDVDPLSPENAIVFAVGPITDTTVVGNSRCCVGTKSPLTGLFFDSTFGGQFPCTFKRTGFDAIVLTGKAARPVYLVLEETGVTIKPADGLWGKTTGEAIQAVLEREGADADVLAIGPGGERLVRFACCCHYWKHREAIAGRGGMGAVLGSKNVKAVAVRGKRRTEVADPAALKAVIDATREDLKKGTHGLKVYGTPVLVNPINALGGLGWRNMQGEVVPDVDKISGETYKEDFWVRDTTCLKCSVACGKTFEVKDGEWTGLRWKLPEFETIFALGTLNAHVDAAALVKGEELCDQLGLDTISMGVTIAFANEAFERGLLTERETGIPLRFGDPRLVLRLIEMTAYRSGFGDWLAEGSARLASRLGAEQTREFLYTAKGLELPAHSPRALKGMAMGYATGTRGGSHHDARPTPTYAKVVDRFSTADKPAFACRSQNFTAVGDSLVLCRFTAERGLGLFLNENYRAVIAAVTGWDCSLEEVEAMGERIYTLERAYNCREGVRRKDDTLPYRVLHVPIPEGPSKGMHCPPGELDPLLSEYYRLRGWDGEGVPTPETLRRLGLEFAIAR